jgi:hypothetical protein
MRRMRCVGNQHGSPRAGMLRFARNAPGTGFVNADMVRGTVGDSDYSGHRGVWGGSQHAQFPSRRVEVALCRATGNGPGAVRRQTDVCTNRSHQLWRPTYHTHKYRHSLFRETVVVGASAESYHKGGGVDRPEPSTTFPVRTETRWCLAWTHSTGAKLVDWGINGALYFDFYHSHRTKPMRKRVRF